MAKKNRPISAPPISTPVTVAPVRLRLRKIANGTSGFVVRVSMMANATSSAAATASGLDLDAVDDAVDEGDQAAGDGDRAERVERALPVVTLDSRSTVGASAPPRSRSAC